MHISIEHIDGKYPSFNVNLHSKEGAQAFLTVKSCRIVDGSKGPFVSWPARKMDSGKYFNFCYASEAFSDAVIAEARKNQPKEDTRTHGERTGRRVAQDDDSQIPF